MALETRIAEIDGWLGKRTDALLAPATMPTPHIKRRPLAPRQPGDSQLATPAQGIRAYPAHMIGEVAFFALHDEDADFGPGHAYTRTGAADTALSQRTGFVAILASTSFQVETANSDGTAWNYLEPYSLQVPILGGVEVDLEDIR